MKNQKLNRREIKWKNQIRKQWIKVVNVGNVNLKDED